MGSIQYVLEITCAPNQKSRMVWSVDRYGAPTLKSLSRLVNAHNLNRDREELGRRPWWTARIIEHGTGLEVVFYKPEIDAIGRRLEK